MVQHHKYSITEIYDMYPYERDVFVIMLQEFIQEQEKNQNG
jgi:hypothetical protein